MRTATLGRLLKAGISLLVLAATVVGLPLLLAWATPVIWASSHDDLTHLLDRQDTGSVFLLALIAVGWTGWTQFTYCTAQELAAQLRGRRWHAPRGLGASQRAAALLVGSILVLLSTGSALASDAQASTTATATRNPSQASASPQTVRAEQSTRASSADGRPVYTVREVRPAESLWSIAEKELGNGERWREIADLNEGRTMTDGTVFRTSSFLQSGWQLQMPESAATADGMRTQLSHSAPVAGNNVERVVTVHSGDYLSKIAQDELGDGSAWPSLFTASKGRPQPHGLPAITDPDIIYAGQQIPLPATRKDQRSHSRDQAREPDSQATTPPATRTPDDGKAHGEETGDGQTPAPSQSATPAPPSTPSTRTPGQSGQKVASPSAAASDNLSPGVHRPEAAASPTASAQPSDSVAASPTQTPPSPAGARISRPLNLRIVLGAGALLAAAITGALARRRTLQRRRRQPGETIAIAPQTAPAEAQLAAATEPAAASRLDIALRTLAHRADLDNRTAPALRGARLGAHSVCVLPDDLTSPPQPPFTAGAADWWELEGAAHLLSESEAGTVEPPCPALVTVGSTESGDLVLANLARLPTLLLDGNPGHISEVCTSLALELGMSPWAQHVEIVAVGFGEDLPTLLPSSRIAHMRRPEHALRDLTERLLEVHQMPETADHPYVLLCASAMDDDTAWQFADILGKTPAIPVTLIAPAARCASHFPEADILAVSAQTPQRFDPLGTDIQVQRLEHTAYQQIITALAVSGQPAIPAQGPWQHVPGEGDPTQPTAPSTQPEQAGTPSADPSTSPYSPAPTESSAGDSVFPALLQASADPAALTPSTSVPDPVSSRPAEASYTTSQDETHPSATPLYPNPVEKPGRTQDSGAPAGPEIRVLGPIEVEGVGTTGHGPRTAQLAALLYFRPGRTSDGLCADMDPISPWSTTTLNARLQDLRRALGNDQNGNPHVPRRHNADTPYRLADSVTCDWTRFLHIAEYALPHASDSLPDLENALALVRGRPFGTRPPAWAEPHQQEMITRIIDVAHTIATLRTAPGPDRNLAAARQAVAVGLEVDDSAELLYRAWFRIEHASGNRSGLHTAISRLQQVNRAIDASQELETQHLIHELLDSPSQLARPV